MSHKFDFLKTSKPQVSNNLRTQKSNAPDIQLADTSNVSQSESEGVKGVMATPSSDGVDDKHHLCTQQPNISDIRPSGNLGAHHFTSSSIRGAGSSTTRGRPSGKRTDPDFAQVTAYIRKATHHGVKLRLLQEGQGREFSELVEELLAGWLTD